MIKSSTWPISPEFLEITSAVSAFHDASGLMSGKNDLLIHKMDVLTANGTMRTELKLPWELATRCDAWGSSLHWPSTTKRYSYRPARRLKWATHFPSPLLFSGVASGCQSLKLPATCTFLAAGAKNVRIASCSSNAGNRSETGCMGNGGLLFPEGRASIALGLTGAAGVLSPILPKPAVKALVSRLTYDFFILTWLHWLTGTCFVRSAHVWISRNFR